MSKQPSEEITVTMGGGNVFADLGLEDAEELQVKTDLAIEIYKRIKALGLSQSQAAVRLGIGQPDVSRLMNGRHTRFSVDRLFALLNLLEVDVEILLRPHRRHPSRRGTIRVMEASKPREKKVA